MKANVLDLQGKSKRQLELPRVFSTDLRMEVIRRAFLVTQSKKRQAYGPDKMAGKRTSANYFGSRGLPQRKKMMNREMSRLKRIFGDTAGGLFMRGRFTPQAVKGRKAHPPKPEKKWDLKINKKEKTLAIKSAIAATIMEDVVKTRGHKIDGLELPLIIDDSVHKMDKTKDVIDLLIKIGLEKELERGKQKKVRPGKGKMRGRKYKKKKSVLFIVDKNDKIVKAVKNISGADVCLAKDVSVELLAPGAHPGRITVYSESAIKKLGDIYG